VLSLAIFGHQITLNGPKTLQKPGLQNIPDARREIGLMHSPIAADVFLQHSRAKGTLETYY
jgi:hypothetical protein